MVVCPKCGKEYSLGRTIYHKCEGFSIHHGVICCGPQERYPWNCSCIKRDDFSEMDFKNAIKKIESTIRLLKISYEPYFP